MAVDQKRSPKYLSVDNLPISPARITGIVLFFVGWYAAAYVFPNNLMPYPLTTAELVWGLIETGRAWPHLGATLWRVVVAWFISMILAISIGTVMGVNTVGKKLFLSWTIVGLSIPGIVWAATGVIVFGFSNIVPIGVHVMIGTPFMIVFVWKGVENINWELIEMSQSFGVSTPRILYRSVLRDTAPALFTTNRFGIAMAWKGVTIGELFASRLGVGAMLVEAYDVFKFEEAWAWGILFLLVMLITEYGLLIPLQERAFKYRDDVDFGVL